MTQRRVLRYEVPADGQSHKIGAGPVLMAQRWRQAGDSPHPCGRIEVWVDAELPDAWPAVDGPTRLTTIIGTGHDIPDSATWLASCLDGPLVWHLYQLGPAS